jgi:hypothetical protein
MSREYTRAVLRLSCDERLVGGVGAAMAYFAERAGLEERSRESLVAALEEFCLDSLSSIQGTEEPLDVAIEDFEDRIQIVVEHPNPKDAAPAARAAWSANAEFGPQRMALSRLAAVVDRVECDTRNRCVRTTLVKFL